MITARLLKCLLLVGFLLVLPVAIFAQQVDTLPGAEEIISRANSFGATHDFSSAVALLKQALDRYPSYPPLYQALATWQETAAQAQLAGTRTGLGRLSAVGHAQLIHDPVISRELLDTYGLAIACLPDPRVMRQHVQALLSDDFPVCLGEHGLPALPGDPEFVTYTLSDPLLPSTERGLRQGLITSHPLAPAAAFQRDPKYGRGENKLDPSWSFAHILYAYAYDSNTQSWMLRFRVMWQDAPGKTEERRQFAQQTARLLLHLSGVVTAYTGLSPKFTDHGAVNVWLAEQHDAGGEALNENLYLYAMDTPRTPAEWVREIAHEYGHLSLPPVAGYTQPESQATGRLGERLFVHWLLRNPEPDGTRHPWLQALDGDEFVTARYAPFISRFAQVGPTGPAIEGTGEEAMDLFIGLALYLDAARGSRLLGGALKDMRTPAFTGPNGFRDSVESTEQYLQATDHPVVVLHVRDVPSGIPYYVYLVNGNWNGELSGTDLQPALLTLSLDGKTVPLDLQGTFQFANVAQGWHKVEVKAAEGTPVPELTTLKFSLAAQAVMGAR